MVPIRNKWGHKFHLYPGHRKAGWFEKGQTPWNKGIPCSEEQKKKISETKKGHSLPNSGSFKLGQKAWNKGMPCSEEVKQKISESKRGHTLPNSGSFKPGNVPKHKIYRTVTMIPCACGCGQETEDIDRRGRPRKYVHGHGAKTGWFVEGEKAREKNPNWKEGKKLMSNGYILAIAPDHPRADKRGYYREHILVMEKKLGRYLTEDEEVHHLDGNRTNNRPENLVLCNNHVEHMRDYHSKTSKQRQKSNNIID